MAFLGINHAPGWRRPRKHGFQNTSHFTFQVMKGILVFCLLALARIGLGANAIVFQDNFDGAGLNPAWKITTSGTGRIELSNAYPPFSADGQLVFDDSVNDAQYSIAEATLTLNLAAKKNVVL